MEKQTQELRGPRSGVKIGAVLGVIAVVAGTFSLGVFRRGSDGKPLVHVADEVPLEVKVASPERREVIRLVQVPGEVEAVLEVDISSEVVAQIEEMPIEEGDLVEKGDLLCRLDDDNLLAEVESGAARVERIKASIRQGEAEYEKAERDMQRQIQLSESNATSVREMADYRIALKRALAGLDMRRQELVEAEALLRRVKEDLKRTIIESPIAGIVSTLNAKQGEVVVTGTMNNPGTVIMTISDMSRMQVRARVDEIDVPLVKPGQKARLYLQSDQDHPVEAVVARVGTKGSKPAGRDVVTFETILEVTTSDERIRPGMTANVEIEVAHREQAITVPVEAVVHRLRKDLAESIVKEFDSRRAGANLSDRAKQAQYIKVIYVKEDDEARIRLIDTGISDSRRVELTRGVQPGETVIVGPYRSLDQLKDGRKVALVEEKAKEGQDTEDSDDAAEERSAQGEPDETPQSTDGDSNTASESSSEDQDGSSS